MNGREVYDCNNTNHVVKIKNLLEYSPTYPQSTATNEFYYLDTSRHTEERATAANTPPFNRGFASRKALLGLSATVNTEILKIKQAPILRETR